MERRAVAERVFHAAAEAWREGAESGVRGAGAVGGVILFTGQGDVSPELLTLWGLRDRVGWRVSQVFDGAPESGVNAAMKGASVLIVTDGKTGMTGGKRTAPGADERMMEWVMREAGWVVVARVKGLEGSGEFVGVGKRE